MTEQFFPFRNEDTVEPKPLDDYEEMVQQEKEIEEEHKRFMKYDG